MEWFRRGRQHASTADIANAGLIRGRNDGSSVLLFGQFNGSDLALPSPFSFCFVSPLTENHLFAENLRRWPGSVLCLDIDGRYCEASFAARAAIQRAYRFDPFLSDTVRINPLAYLPDEPVSCLKHLQTITRTLWPRNPEDFRVEFASSLFQGGVLYLRDSREVPRFDNVSRIGNLFGDVDSEGLKRFAASRGEEGFPLSPQTIRALGGFCALPKDAKETVLAIYNDGLALFEDIRIDHAVSDNDIDLAQLGAKPSTIYLCCPREYLTGLAPLFNILVSQAISANFRPLANGDVRTETLFCLDHFPSLGRVSFLEKNIAQAGRHGLSFLMGDTSRSKLTAAYGEKGAAHIEKHCDGHGLYLPTKDGSSPSCEDEVLFSIKPMKPIRTRWRRGE